MSAFVACPCGKYLCGVREPATAAGSHEVMYITLPEENLSASETHGDCYGRLLKRNLVTTIATAIKDR